MPLDSFEERPQLQSVVAEGPVLTIQDLASDLVDHVDFLRLDACRQLEQGERRELGQFLTPAPVARLMASMVQAHTSDVSILDAGAGVGSLFSACVAELCRRTSKPKKIHVTAYEIDVTLLNYLNSTLELCRQLCNQVGVAFSADVKPVDFLEDALLTLNGDLFVKSARPNFTVAILNPPYRKINSASRARIVLRQLGIETTNLYTGFLATAIELLAPAGELIAITPRSFCNGTYFRSFRASFLREMALRQIHLFDSRQDAFRGDAVLQETVIVDAVKQRVRPTLVTVTVSSSAEDEGLLRVLPYEEVVHPTDPEQFIRVVPDRLGQQIVSRMGSFTALLEDLRLSVSTGRVVDFRVSPYLRASPDETTAPLIYPTNFAGRVIHWPKDTKKPQAIFISKETESQLIPNAVYVLVKRFSSKEEKKRVVAAVFEPKEKYDSVGFENHLNYFHAAGRGLDLAVAKGLSTFLNSTLVDTYFRQFNGHTQVNATDLRSLRYPSLDQLKRLGEKNVGLDIGQADIDKLIEGEFFSMTEASNSDPIATKKRIDESLEVLVALGLPRAQINDRSALTLLALLDLRPSDPWSASTSPLRGITPIMEFMDQEYGKRYAPNSRETVRRQTMHQFLDAGIVVANPDKPDRPINSGKFVYRVDTSALELLRTFGTELWEKSLETFLSSVETLKKRYAQEREMTRIPIEIAPGKTITLSPGGQNVLVEQIIAEFAPRFTPGGKLLYVGDTDEKYAHIDSEALTALGITLDTHGKMPDVIIHYSEKNWLILIEAVTSHGPINPKRHKELHTLFKTSSAGIVLVTTFLGRQAMMQYLPEISWETEVWVAESPGHMIHFNGERFLGPYEKSV